MALLPLALVEVEVELSQQVLEVVEVLFLLVLVVLWKDLLISSLNPLFLI